MLVKVRSDFETLDAFEHALTAAKEYEVIGIECNEFRVVNDCGEPILYPPYLFDVIDPKIPDYWHRNYVGGDLYANPPEFHRRGFYENYFDDIAEAVDLFEEFARRHGLAIKSRKSKEKGKEKGSG